MIRLIIFDVDGTLVENHTTRLLPGVRNFFRSVTSGRCLLFPPPEFAIATNQGGVGMHYWMEQSHFGHPERYPNQSEIERRMNELVSELACTGKMPVYMSFRFKDWRGKWSPVPPEAAGDLRWNADWRKPRPGMLLKAMEEAGVTVGQTLFVGDRTEDRDAARAANCSFAWARDFFSRDWEDCESLKELMK
jgi:HAD superfamily hydrolase (TIGR01662 family)